MNLEAIITVTSFVIISIFFFILFVLVLLPKANLIFTKRHGRQHSMFGILYLTWISFGFYETLSPYQLLISTWMYDVIL